LHSWQWGGQLQLLWSQPRLQARSGLNAPSPVLTATAMISGATSAPVTLLHVLKMLVDCICPPCMTWRPASPDSHCNIATLREAKQNALLQSIQCLGGYRSLRIINYPALCCEQYRLDQNVHKELLAAMDACHMPTALQTGPTRAVQHARKRNTQNPKRQGSQLANHRPGGDKDPGASYWSSTSLSDLKYSW
jgi:hypothetical protein